MFKCKLIGLLFTFLLASPALTDEVELVNGEHLAGTIKEVDRGTVIFVHPILGTLNIPLDKIRGIDGVDTASYLASHDETPAADLSRQEKRAAAADDAQAETPESRVEEDEPEWKGSFNLSGSSNSGTTDNASLFTSLKFTRDNDFEKTEISTFYRFASNNSKTTQSWYNLTANQVWKLPNIDSKWRIFADGQFDWSEQNTWQQRISAHAGGQYPLIMLSKEEDESLWFDSFSLQARAGIGPRKEFAGDETDLIPEAEFGGIADWQISKGQSVEAHASWLPDVLDFSEYRVDAGLNWKVALEDLDGLSLALGLTFQYQSYVSNNDKNYDLLATIGLIYDF